MRDGGAVRNHAAPRRHGDVLGEGRGPRPLPLLRSQHGREIAAACRTGMRRSGGAITVRPDRPVLSSGSFASRPARPSASRCWRDGCIRRVACSRPTFSSPSPRTPERIGEMTDHAARARHARRQGLARASLCLVNFSPRQISDPELSQREFSACSTKRCFPPHRLMIEITESAVVQKLGRRQGRAAIASQCRRAHRARRFRHRLFRPLSFARARTRHAIKIDRSFVMQDAEQAGGGQDRQSNAQTRPSLWACTTTAEGIETEEVLEQLLKLGCDTGQGYLFGSADRDAPPQRDERCSRRRFALRHIA